ncbi:MAG: glyoxylate/hydroxypyruvate reductase A [Pseudomonadota bacterium]
MALLIDVGMPEWMEDEALKTDVLALLPDAEVRTIAEPGDMSDIDMLATTRLRPDLPAQLPNLKLVQKLGAGVDTMVSHPGLAENVRITRLKPDAPAREIAEYCVTYVLRDQRNLNLHAANQAKGIWEPVAPRRTPETTVAVLGLGHIGGRAARMFAALEFNVIGWSRSPKYTEGIDCRWGMDTLPALLAESDYICSILPSTELTRGLFGATVLSAMKPGSVLINAGRGDLIVEGDLIAALNAGAPGHAVLDVLPVEPLPAGHAFWTHPAITVTPHVSGWHLGDALKDVAENYRRLSAGQPLLHEVDRARGY